MFSIVAAEEFFIAAVGDGGYIHDAGGEKCGARADGVHRQRRATNFEELISWPAHLAALVRTDAAIWSSVAPERINVFTSLRYGYAR